MLFFLSFFFVFFLTEVKQMMKCSRKEITTIQVFGKTAKNGPKSITVVSKSHWHSPVVDSVRGLMSYWMKY